MRPASLLFLLACLAGVALALLGDEPLVGLALAAVLLYPLGVFLTVDPGAGEDDRRRVDRSRSGAPSSRPSRAPSSSHS